MADGLERIKARIKQHQYGSRKLSFTVAAQERSSWCWAAVATSVATFLNGTAISQQALVSQAFGVDCSGAKGGNSICNKAWHLVEAFRLLDCQVITRSCSPQLLLVKHEVDGGRPLCAQIAWNSGGAHLATIVGYSIAKDGTEYFHVSDPWYGQKDLPVAEFTQNYESGGTWTHTFRLIQAVNEARTGQ
ncbi:papain-like cysteine protease family protein [uncultured Agrobacterium sp.]|uniref:papain-like cysteine protease family protein n=1 Tax=uncultured Agrobacterium sp. TaxID=157277 RepID=UPI0025D0F93C|nr:papain-like cysteine protease family protein [uncultured Agrobacterium sp.]